MASAWWRQKAASTANWAFGTGAWLSAAVRLKCVAASLSSATERGPTSQAPFRPPSTSARMWWACSSSGAALTTLADSALIPSSFHHSGLATSSHTSCTSRLKANAVANAQSIEPTEKRSLASRNRCAASTTCSELLSAAPRLWYAVGLSGLRAMASRKALAALRQSCLEWYSPPSATSSWYSSPDCAAMRASCSAVSRARCCAAPPSSATFCCTFTAL
eukprot:scaffold39038_cov62-Phaeocystis_antarctica.AAC.1